MHYGVIMAGGAGTRLWPFSRNSRPKQLLNVIRGKSMLRLSYDRLRGVLPPERIYVCTGESYRGQILENLPELPGENLLGEPEGRDTANAVGFSAAVLQKRDPDAICAVVSGCRSRCLSASACSRSGRLRNCHSAFSTAMASRSRWALAFSFCSCSACSVVSYLIE